MAAKRYPARRPAGRRRRRWGFRRVKKGYRRYREGEMRLQRLAGATLMCLHVASGLFYLVWLATRLNLDAWYVTVPFLLAEIVSLLAITYFASTIRHPRQHRRRAASQESPRLSLDVWISTCGEPLPVLEPTVAAAVRLEYPGKTIYILDDGGSDEVARVAAAHGCRYLRRSEHADAKSGNLNHALERTGGELILVLDADQVPEADLMERVGGYFNSPHVGFVQTAQRYSLASSDRWGNEEALFYRVIQKSKDADNAAFSCGSGVVYRRSALASIGGFSTWNLVEDVHTSMRLHAQGWRSVYHGYPLSIGTAPTDILGYARQRGQWAVDSLRMLFWDNPFRYPGLSLSQKLQYGYTGAAYLIAGFIVPFYFFVPVWSTLSGNFVILTPAWVYAVVRGVYLVFTYAMLRVLESPVAGFKSYRFWAGLFPTFMAAAVRALRAHHTKPTYRVTSKVVERPSYGLRLRAVWPQLAVMLLVLASLPWGWIRQTLPTDSLAVNSLWSLWTVWTLLPIVREALRGTPLTVDVP